jgi:hypothetical protein
MFCNKSNLIALLLIVNFILVFLIVRRSFQNSQNQDVKIATQLSSILDFGVDQIGTGKIDNGPRIAYVFAGSIRSFVCPKVHWSIRSHLIDSLGGQPSVFIRTSTEDNWNSKTGKGSQWSPNYKNNEVDEALKILNPVQIEHFSFANQTTEMKANYPWLEPLDPIEMYNYDRVWLTETGFDLFNDQFMLILRQFSDYIYDLDSKVVHTFYFLVSIINELTYMHTIQKRYLLSGRSRR